MFNRLREVAAEISIVTNETISVELKSTRKNGYISIKGNINKVIKKLDISNKNSYDFRLICSFIYALNRVLYERDHWHIKNYNKHLAKIEGENNDLIKECREIELINLLKMCNKEFEECLEKGD